MDEDRKTGMIMYAQGDDVSIRIVECIACKRKQIYHRKMNK